MNKKLNIAQPNYDKLKESKIPKEFEKGAGELKATEKGPSVRVGKLQHNSEQSLITSTGFTNDEKIRIREYAKLVNDVLNSKLSGENQKKKIAQIYKNNKKFLTQGGFLSTESKILAIEKMRSNGELNDEEAKNIKEILLEENQDQGTIWDKTIDNI